MQVTGSLLREPGFLAYLVSATVARFAQAALTVMLGYHLFLLTHDPLSLGGLGLVQALPAITLVLYGGHVADRHSRRTIALITRVAFVVLAALLAMAALALTEALVPAIYVVAFGLGCVGAFSSPAISGLEAEVIPRSRAIRAVSVLGSASQASSLAGLGIGGLAFDLVGPSGTYALIAALLAASTLVMLLGVTNTQAPPRTAGDGAIARIIEGIRVVMADQILVGSMAIDLFAVFFGGASALLPIFATDILHVGSTGFSALRMAISIGSLAAMLIAVRHPPRVRAGLALHFAIAGFGISIITFALSRNFILSLLALAAAGACDGVSMVVRQAILRLVAPGPLRGRISAVRSVFISSSNELGEFESGVLAKLVGTVPSVWIGGSITLVVVGLTAWLAPKLRQLDLDALEHHGDDPAEVSRPVSVVQDATA